jgi:NADH dehydrogenase
LTRKTQIVVVGGGAGGLELVRRLGARYGRKRHDIILVEKNRTHIWKPLLHEVAAGSLDANLDEVGYRSHCHRWGYRYFCGALESVDRAARQVILAPLVDEDGSELIGRHAIRYDYLVIAIGSVSNDFGTPGVAEHCLCLDDRTGADRFRNRLLDHCLRVSREMSVNPAADAHVRIIIVGGGATGVELAAELYNAAAALRFYGLEVFDESRLQITLIEAGPRILPALPERLAEAAHEELEALGVEVCTGVRVTEAVAHAILTADGRRIEADLMVWAAGVKAPPILAGLGRAPDGGERVWQPRAADGRQAAAAVRLPRPRLAGIAEPLFDRRQPDGQPDRRAHGDRGAAGPLRLHLALPHAPDRDPRLAEGSGVARDRARQPHHPPAAEAALVAEHRRPMMLG